MDTIGPGRKNVGVAVLMAIIGGLIGLPGFGLIYIRKFNVGILILFLDFTVYSIMGANMVISSSGSGYALFSILMLAVHIVVWVWTIYYTWTQAKRYNEYMGTHGGRPW